MRKKINKVNTPYDHKEVTSILANERTYAAWIRTGLTSLATGLVVAKFLPGTISWHIVQIMTITLLLSSALSFYLAAWRYIHVSRRLETTKIFGAPIMLLAIGSGFLILISALAIYGIWVRH